MLHQPHYSRVFWTLKLDAMAQGLIEQREHPTTRGSASRSAWGCWSTGSSPTGEPTTAALSEDRPSCERRPPSRTSTSGAGGDLKSPRCSSLADGHWVDAQPRRGHRGSDRGGQDISRLCARPRGHPPRPHRALRAAPRAVRRTRPSPGPTDGCPASWPAGPGWGSSWSTTSCCVRSIPIRPPTCSRSSRTAARLRSTIITSQLPVSMWHEALGDATIADAVLDRVLQNAHRIELSGESMRQPSEPPNRSKPAK